MRRFRWLASAVLGVFFLVLLGIFTMMAGELVEERYDTYGDAEDAGAIERGWIPPFVPRSATDIVDVHHLDTNAQALRFRAPAVDLEEMTANLSETATDEMPTVPEVLRNRVERVSYYRAMGPGERSICVGVIGARAEALVWTCRGVVDQWFER